MGDRALEEDVSFTPLGITEERVTHAERAEARSGYAVYRGQDGFEAAIPETVLERMVALGRRSAPEEWYGLLVGRLYNDGLGRHVVVLGVVPDPEASAGASFVRTRCDSELRTRTAGSLLYPDGVPVGWAHGHVRHGARFSATDFRNQATWTQPHALGIVVDAFREPRVGVYRGPDGELLERAPETGGLLVHAEAEANGSAGRVAVIGAKAPERSTGVGRTLRILRVLVLAHFMVLLSAGAFFAWRGYEAAVQTKSLSLRVRHLEEAQPNAASGSNSAVPATNAAPPDAGAEAPVDPRP